MGGTVQMKKSGLVQAGERIFFLCPCCSDIYRLIATKGALPADQQGLEVHFVEAA